MKPTLAISMGDPAGISPEIIARSLDDTCHRARPVVFGHLPTMKALLSPDWVARLVLLSDPAPVDDGLVGFVPVGGGDAPIVAPGPAAGAVQLDALAAATSSMLDGRFDALVTAPVSKHAIAALGTFFSGHTEYLARRSGLAKDDVTMVFASKPLSVGLVTTHLPLREVPDAVTWKRLARTFTHVTESRRLLAPQESGTVAIAALNPHAGEDGLFGAEEGRLYEPFCQAARARGEAIAGPLPADTVFRDALQGLYSGVVASYHDQALIPLKLGGVGQMVNVTMGLPFVRTSPDHGVAYEIARTGRADPSGFVLAMRLAVQMAEARKARG